VITKSDLKAWVVSALRDLGGSGRVVEIAKHIWENHENDLKEAGDLFYTWQYAMRWAGQELQLEGKLLKGGKNRSWSLTP
jgi:hypothetical protein